MKIIVGTLPEVCHTIILIVIKRLGAYQKATNVEFIVKSELQTSVLLPRQAVMTIVSAAKSAANNSECQIYFPR